METNYQGHDAIEKWKYADVKYRITETIKQWINEAIKDCRDIDWDDLREYCYEFWNVPKSTIDECIIKAKEESLYGTQIN